LQSYIIEKLKKKWSPKVIAGSWNKLGNDTTISHESIYSWIYNEASQDVRKLLPRAKGKRGLVRKKPKKSKIPNRVGIEQRPQEIEDRSVVGHFEGDLVFNRGSMSSNTLTVIERKSRYAILVKNETKQSMEVIAGLKKYSKNIGLRSITFDNGSEFARHELLKDIPNVETYFCDPGKPWQKGSIEHLNGMLRRRISFDTAPENITQELLDSVAYELNHMPRKILNFMSPCEIFHQSLEGKQTGCCSRKQQENALDFKLKQSGGAFYS
jgi:IS30 family transposase